MIEEKEKQGAQTEAVEAVERDIKAAETLQEERMGIPERMRKSWNRIAYQSTAGCRSIRAAVTLVVFFSLYVSVRHGMAVPGSLINDVAAKLPETLSSIEAVIIGAEVLVALFWLAVPSVGTAACAALLYLCFADTAPIALGLGFSVLLLFQFEDRPVTALMIALAPITLLTPLRIGLLAVLVVGFISSRNNNGVVKALAPVYFALLELSDGCFGVFANSIGKQLMPSPIGGIKAAWKIRGLFNAVASGGAEDPLFKEILLLLAVFFVIGLVFSKLLDLRFSVKKKFRGKKLSQEYKDGILLAIMLLLLCLAPWAVKRLTIVREFGYGYGSIVLQTLGAYILTRPIACRSPKRGETVAGGDKNYIFVSYAHNDIDRIRPYLKLLSRQGYEFWYDDSIRTGTEWQGVIASNLTNCTCFLAFISKTSVESEYCLKEINYATSKKKPMAVIVLDNVELPPVLEMHFASLQIVAREKFGSDEECMQKIFEMEQLEACKYEENS